MTGRRLNRNELIAIVGNDPRALRAFERIFNTVDASIAGAASLVLNYNSEGVLTSPLPLVSSYSLVPENGATFLSGVSWGVTVLSGSFVGAPPTIAGTGRAQLQINSGLATPSAVVAVTARVSGRGYAPLSVTISQRIAAPAGGGGGATPSASDTSMSTFSSDVFAVISKELPITLPAGVTEAVLTAPSIGLDLDATAPAGPTGVEMKWQRETSPGVWGDVGVEATSSPDPNIIDEGGGLFFPVFGSITCNRTETGMAAGSAQNFRVVARVSSGNIRTVYPIGTASVTA